MIYEDKFSLRLPQGTLRKVKALCQRLDISVNKWVKHLILKEVEKANGVERKEEKAS